MTFTWFDTKKLKFYTPVHMDLFLRSAWMKRGVFTVTCLGGTHKPINGSSGRFTI